MEKKIAVILGDGIGPEVTQQSIKVLNRLLNIITINSHMKMH